jgi:hypothetical protein
LVGVVHKSDDKQALHDQVMGKVEEALTEARVEMSATLRALPWRVAECVQEQGLAPAEVVPVVLEFISRGSNYETWAEDFLACTKECLNTTVGANKKLSREIQDVLDDAGWGPAETVRHLVEFTMQGLPNNRLNWANEVDAWLAHCASGPDLDEGPEAEEGQTLPGLR